MSRHVALGDEATFIVSGALSLNELRKNAVSTNVHRDATATNAVTYGTLSGTDAAATAAAIAAANELMQRYLDHIKDIDGTIGTMRSGWYGVKHKGTWAVPTLVVATDLTTACTLCDAIKADYASHRADTTAHDNADSSNTWTATAATTLATLQTSLNAAKTAFNAHNAAALAGNSIRIVPG